MDLEQRAAELPKEPGVYLFKTARGKVLYVGKAQNLRSRVRSYLSPGGDGRYRVPYLVERSEDIDVLVTANVKDALLLENELIKQHKPTFNVRLRDDKQYLALRIDPSDPWPRLLPVRKFARDGAQYFGPYTSSQSMRDAISNLRRIFPLRSCRDGTFRDYERRGRPCIEYEMKRCSGPCCGLVTREAYAETVEGTILFLKGESTRLVEELESKMRAAAEAERFEDAARLRDRITAVERTVERQQIVSEKPIDRDVFGLARRGGEVAVQALLVREGRVIGTGEYGFSDVRIDDAEVMESFLGQYYTTRGDTSWPSEVLTSTEVRDGEALVGFLSERSPNRVALRKPQRGKLRELVDMAVRNAELALTTRLEARDSVVRSLEELQRKLHLDDLPRHIECYDISNLQGTLPVGSRVVFIDGRPEKSLYRRYRIKQAQGGDDLACLREVFERRLAKVDRDPLPDLLVVDGGRGQVAVTTAALADAGLSVDHVGIAKEKDEESPSPRVKRSGGLKADRIFLAGRTNPVMLLPNSRGLLLLQRVRDEAHRFAIEYQRELRRRLNLTSILEELPGIGPRKRRALLRHFGSLRRVREATVDELGLVEGIHAADAEAISAFFRAVTSDTATDDAGEDAGEAPSG